MAVDDLRLKVSLSDYLKKISTLDSKIAGLEGVLKEYEALQRNANRVLGDDDDNLNNLREMLQRNIKSVQGQKKILEEQKRMLEDQVDRLGNLRENVGSMIQEGIGVASTAFNTIKIVGDLVN